MSSADLLDKFGQNVGKKFLKDRITTIMSHNHVPIDLQKMIIFAVDNSIEYVDLCIKLNKKPDDPKVLTEFLINKGVFIAKLASDDIKCAVSLIELANGLRKNIPKARGPVPAAIVVSLTLLDVLSVGNSCTFVQEAYYHYVLEDPHGTSHVTAPRRQVRRTEAKPAPDPLAFLKSMDPKSRVRCEAAMASNRKAKDISIRLP